MPVDPHSHVPIYEQIVEHIHGRITAGVFRPDEPLPSIRALAIELLVNPNTVQRAYQELERQGVAYTQKGLGVFVAANGAISARSMSEASVCERFEQGIDLARAAGLGDPTIRRLFDRSLHEVRETSSRHSTNGPSLPGEEASS
ncbi:MAG: GntR family transcriptional regulator [Phycisphaerae bacterium]|nr:GntR family transcriptional regulator [Phycisphaerae bacterium]